MFEDVLKDLSEFQQDEQVDHEHCGPRFRVREVPKSKIGTMGTSYHIRNGAKSRLMETLGDFEIPAMPSSLVRRIHQTWRRISMGSSCRTWAGHMCGSCEIGAGKPIYYKLHVSESLTFFH